MTALGTLALFLWIHVLRVTTPINGLTPIFFILFSYFDYWGAVGLLLATLAAVLVSERFSGLPLLRWIGEHPVTMAVATALVLCLGSLFVYQNHPLSMDEYAPVFQSHAFAAGELTGRLPPPLLDWLIPRGFQNQFLNVSRVTGQVTSSYWPSFAILLTPFSWLGIPWACNPVLSGATVLVVHRIARRLFIEPEYAGLAVLLTIASSVFFANGISYYSMTAHMLASALFTLLVLEATPRRLVAAGAVGALALTLHNPLPHILYATPWILWLVFRENGLRNAAWLALGYVPLSVLLGIVWFVFNTDFMAVSTTAGSSRGVGFLASVFSTPTPAVLIARVIGLAKVWLWAVPGVLILAAIGAWKLRGDVRLRLLAASAALTFIGFLFVPMDQGHGWGFRYFHSAWVVLPLLATAALVMAPQAHAAPMRTFVVACAVFSLLGGVGLRASQMHEFMTDHLRQRPGYSGTEPRVVFIDYSHSFYGVDLIQNDPFLRGNLIQMVSHGPEANALLMHELKPNFRRVHVDRYGEVWSGATP